MRRCCFSGGREGVLRSEIKSLERKSNIQAMRLPASVMSQVEGARDRRKYREMLHFRDWIDAVQIVPDLGPQNPLQS